MQLKFNGLVQQAAENLITFSDVPNILDVSDTTGGTHAMISLTVGDNFSASGNNQYWLEIQGETISNVLDPDMAVNKNFYISTYKYSTAASIVKALRACPAITSKFLVYLDVTNPVAYLKAREIGEIDLTINMADGMPNYVTTATTAGTASSTLNNTNINVDIYSNGEYITSLTKRFYDNGCKFDVTPVLATLSEINVVTPYDMYISFTKSGITSNLGSITGNYAGVGYQVNQSNPYLTLTNDITIAQNVSRGKLRTVDNNTILYVYGNTIPLSFYTNTTGNTSYSITYKDSAYSTISTISDTVSVTEKLTTFEANISLPSDCFYVDLTIGGKTLRYNVIKPLNASYGYQRIKFINSYGGTSFIDLAGEKQISNESETVTYNKNLLGFYDTQVLEKERVYDTEIKTTYTVKSHLIGEDGKWTFYDLLQSPYAWTEINGKTYVVIIESVTASEINNQGIFEMTVKFHLSQPVSM